VATPRSIPEWTDKQSGTLLIVGSAACVHEDLKAAQSIRPHAHLLLINGAAQLFEHAHHMLCGHGEKAEQFVRARGLKFPDAPPLYIHASRRGGTNPQGVTHIWENVSTGGTSAWKAVRIGKAMGYEELILCGCPLDDSGYAAGESDGIAHGCARIGLGEGRMFNNYRATFKKRAREEGAGVYSMSGYSRELLGAPPEQKAA
jgi:hypothetical protein